MDGRDQDRTNDQANSGNEGAHPAEPRTPDQVADARSLVGSEPIGRVETVTGTVEVIRADGTHVVLAKGDPVFQGDTLQTSADGAVGVVFIDDTTLALGKGGRVVLNEINFDPTSHSGTFDASVEQGVFSFVSGQISKSGVDAMTVHTPVASLGIRGTKVVGEVGSGGHESSFSLLPEEGGFVGEVVITNAGGMQILNQPGATLTVLNGMTAPSVPVLMSIPGLEGRYGWTLNHLPEHALNDGSGFDLANFQTAAGGHTDSGADLANFSTAAGGGGGAEGDSGFDLANFQTAAGGHTDSGADLVNFSTAAGGDSDSGFDLANFQTAGSGQPDDGADLSTFMTATGSNGQGQGQGQGQTGSDTPFAGFVQTSGTPIVTDPPPSTPPASPTPTPVPAPPTFQQTAAAPTTDDTVPPTTPTSDPAPTAPTQQTSPEVSKPSEPPPENTPPGPTVSAPAPVNEAPVAEADTVTTQAGQAIFIDPATLLGNDSDPEGNTLTITSVGNAQHGTVTIDDDGNVVFTPDAGYSAHEGATFEYTVADGHGGTATQVVTVDVNGAPV
ncbi:MAG: cadherin-like domain-containing protein, partial [Alphaproteobacteria bacterium]